MERIIAALERNNFSVIPVSDRAEALIQSKKIVDELDGKMTIAFGGSTTIVQIGLYEYLTTEPRFAARLINPYEDGISFEENIRRRRASNGVDLFIASVNALTEAGELVAVDGSGNRVAALAFGPKRALLVVGRNKLVPDLAAGFKRVKEVAAPLNIERMNKKATAMGKEPRYDWDNIANKFLYINGDEVGRVTIILVDESLGF